MNIQIHSKSALAKISIVIVSIFLMILSVSCDRSIRSPIAPARNMDIPPTPFGLNAFVGDGIITLNWSIENDSSIAIYNIYRSDSITGQFRLIDSTETKAYLDTGLVNGVAYFYRVSSLNEKRFESYPSISVNAIPQVYGIIIDNNRKATNSLEVNIRIIAPEDVRYMRLADDSTFENSVWEYFDSTRVWYLSPPDGEKRVYAEFRDNDDNLTAGYYFDSITLDRIAVIDSVTENSYGSVKTAGDTINFIVYAGEIGGGAYIDIEGGPEGVDLYDNGINGDSVADDGVYSLDYIIPEGVEVVNAAITGHFTDMLGNIADGKQAAKRINIQSSPQGVRLYDIFNITDSSVSISWSANTDDDFSEYRMFRSDNNFEDSVLVEIITDRNTVASNDYDLLPYTRYYYKIWTYDNFGLGSPSNVDSVLTDSLPDPSPVYLFPIIAVDSANGVALGIHWSQNNDYGFESYRLYTDTDQFVDWTSILIADIGQQDSTYIQIGNFEYSQTYYFKVYVYDRMGHYIGSNEQSITTPDPSP